MRDLNALLLDAWMDLCLDAVADLADARDLAPEEVALRRAQWAECAQGLRCPEVAFDPTARRLAAIDEALAARPEARQAWQRTVLDALASPRPPRRSARAA